MKYSFFIIVSIGSVLLGSGCGQTAAQTDVPTGQTSGVSAIGKSYDPCDLLTAADAESFFPGGTAKQTRHDTEPNAVGQKICFYSLSDEDQKFVQLSVIATADMREEARKQGMNAETQFKNEKSFLDASVVQDVTGLGDEAYYGGSGLGLGKGTHVLAKEKGIKFSIDVGLGFGNTDKQKHLDIESALAKKVLERL